MSITFGNLHICNSADHQPVVYSCDLCPACDLTMTIKAWQSTAEQNQENRNFYKDLIIGIGARFGNAAYISDDGSIQDSVIALKVPELVRQLRHHADRLQQENDELEQRLHDLQTAENEDNDIHARVKHRRRHSRRNPHYRRGSSTSLGALLGMAVAGLSYFAGKAGRRD